RLWEIASNASRPCCGPKVLSSNAGIRHSAGLASSPIRALAPNDHDRAAGEALRVSPVAKAEPSPAAKRKARKKRTDDGQPVHSFRTLLADLATLTRNTVRCGKAPEMVLVARPTEIQQRAFDLLGIKLAM